MGSYIPSQRSWGEGREFLGLEQFECWWGTQTKDSPKLFQAAIYIWLMASITGNGRRPMEKTTFWHWPAGVALSGALVETSRG